MNPIDLDAQTLYAQLLAGVARLRAAATQAPTRLVGIASGGVWLAQRLQHDLQLPGAAGVISSTLHRDDFSQRGLGAAVQTQLPFDVNGAHVVLIDDVLYTGRTIRAVVNELFDYGRPASVQLAVLADRGGRELPIAADFAASTVTLPDDQSLALVQEDGQLRWLVKPKKPTKSSLRT